jgi:serine/threonine protein kinase
MKVDHPNIVNIMEIWEWNDLLFLVTDYFEGGDMNDLILEKDYLEESEVYKIMK